jgi:hypothetical protein
MPTTEFWHSQPQKRTREKIGEILKQGTKQIAIAAAYCTKAGVDFLMEHLEHLQLDESFVVVSSNPPTDLCALRTLADKAPDRVLVHYGATSPTETKVGNPLMHSKVFYACDSADNCCLWTGSSNLTASATEGLNYEAAVIVSGHKDEQVFKDALNHLKACWGSALPYKEEMCKPEPPETISTLVVHAKGGGKFPSKPPFEGHLCFPNFSIDRDLRRDLNVVLYLYTDGEIKQGVAPDPRKANFALMGSLTGVNNTEKHPNRGTSGKYEAAAFLIEAKDIETVPKFRSPADGLSVKPTTQCVCAIERVAEKWEEEFFLKSIPKSELVKETGTPQRILINKESKQYFGKRNKQFKGDSALYIPVTDVSRYREVSEDDAERWGETLLSETFEKHFKNALRLETIPRGPADDRNSRYIYMSKFKI